MYDLFCVFLLQGLIADSPYTFVEGVLRDGDGDQVQFMDPVVVEDVDTGETTCVTTMFAGTDVDPELQELEECGGGYLSDGDNCFTIDGDGDKHIVQII